VAIVRNAARPKTLAQKAKRAKAAPEADGGPDYHVIPAEAVSAHDAFGAWESELQSAGHAIIHDKIVVVDPFDDDCVVVAGSHNLGYRASSNNDENFVIVRGHRALAEAYACHVLDVYDHYAWRFWLTQDPEKFGRPLEPDDRWQERYLEDGQPSSPEMKFWLGAVPSVVAHESRGTGTAAHVKQTPPGMEKGDGARVRRREVQGRPLRPRPGNPPMQRGSVPASRQPRRARQPERMGRRPRRPYE
jgi:hypothetical protein